MKVAIIGYGNVGRAFARLVEKKRAAFPFRIVGAHTLRHGSAYEPKGLAPEPVFGPAAECVEEFLDQARAEVAIELTLLNPESGEPAWSFGTRRPPWMARRSTIWFAPTCRASR